MGAARHWDEDLIAAVETAVRGVRGLYQVWVDTVKYLYRINADLAVLIPPVDLALAAKDRDPPYVIAQVCEWVGGCE